MLDGLSRRRRRPWTLALAASLVACVAIAVLACNAGNLNLSSLGGEACEGGVPNLIPLGTTPACRSCIATSCAKAQTCLPTACAAYDKCYCGCAIGDLTCISACQPDLTSACTTCQNGVSTCTGTSCASQCGSLDGGRVGDAGTPVGVCATLAKCCALESGLGRELCYSAANGNNQGICQATYAGLRDAGSCH